MASSSCDFLIFSRGVCASRIFPGPIKNGCPQLFKFGTSVVYDATIVSNPSNVSNSWGSHSKGKWTWHRSAICSFIIFGWNSFRVELSDWAGGFGKKFSRSIGNGIQVAVGLSSLALSKISRLATKIWSAYFTLNLIKPNVYVHTVSQKIYLIFSIFRSWCFRTHKKMRINN